MSTLPQTFGIRFTNNLSNLAYVDDLLRMVFFNAIISTRIAYSWRDCSPSLLWSSRSCSNTSFNLHFVVCRRVPSSLQMVKSNGEREYDSVFLKSTGFPVFKL